MVRKESFFLQIQIQILYSFIVYIKPVDIDKDIAVDVETRFDISNYELECNSSDTKRKK